VRDGQYRLLWSGLSRSKKIREIRGTSRFKRDCHLVFTWLISWGDDDGRLRGDPGWLIENIFPHDGFLKSELEKILSELHRVTLIIWYEVDSERFIQIIKNEEKQKIRKDRYFPSTYPPYINSADSPLSKCGQSADISPQSDNPSLSQLLSLTPSQTLIQTPVRTAKVPPSDSEFDLFWKEYPRKIGKGHARKAWEKIGPEKHQQIIEAIKEQNKEKWNSTETKFIPHPTTWLHGERWEDEIKDDEGDQIPQSILDKIGRGNG